MNLNFTAGQVACIALNPPPLGGFEREVTIPYTLNAAANKIMFCPYQSKSYAAVGRLALVQAVMPPATFEMLRNPICSRTLVAIDDR